MSYNARVKTFVSGGTTFTASTAQGVYVESGDASGPQIVNRMEVLPTGAILDLDGTADAARTPPVIWQELVFQGAHTNAHTQYMNLLGLVGKHGTLTLTIPTASGEATTTVAARLLPLRGEWAAPYRVGTFNQLTIRAEWQLKGLL